MEESCPVRLCVAQVHGPSVVVGAQPRNYRIGNARFNRVRVLGLCVQHIDTELKLDDGTGLLNVKMPSNALELIETELQPGALVDCVGIIDEPWPHSESTRSHRLLRATHVHAVKDLNTETLRMLEILHLHRSYVESSGVSSPVQLELLAFPPHVNDAVSGDAMVPTIGHNTTSVAHSSVVAHGNQFRSGTVIEKPHEQKANGALNFESDIPPAEYQLVVPDDDQRLIEQGKKSLEIRLNAPPYSIIHVNDRIIINGKTSTKVVAVRKYARLESVLQTENVDALIPQRPGFLSVTAAVLRHYRQFFSSDEEEQSGLVVFELAVQSSSTPMSQPEWSPLVLRHLESNPDGCSAPDLRFAFPSLPLEDLMNILTNLQFDGLVIHVNNKYRSV